MSLNCQMDFPEGVGVGVGVKYTTRFMLSHIEVWYCTAMVAVQDPSSIKKTHILNSNSGNHPSVMSQRVLNLTVSSPNPSQVVVQPRNPNH